ncbi:InlB B-repeat-containing protein [Kaistella sp.]|uniref:InlB B-repeat-containing protein n=1 Tax=Kaistella sp. TaxID=2782235 RepID=UPI003C3F602D
MKTNLFLKRLLFLWVLAFSASVWGQTSIQNFGTTDGSNTTNTGNTTLIPNPTSGTTYARGGTGGSVNLIKTSNPLSTTGDYVRAAASTSGAVVKFSPWVGYTNSAEFYTSFEVLFGDSNAGKTATSGVWQFFQGTGSTYSDVNGFSGAQTFVGLQFTYGAGGAIALNYRAGGSWVTTSLTTTSLSSATKYTFEIVGNNKSSGTINYTYNGVSQTVAVQKFDLFINGVKVGDDLAAAQLPVGNNINSGTFIGQNSVSNVANIFVDDAIVYNAVPSSIGTPSYTLTYTAGANGTISGSSPQTVEQGADGSAVTAVPNAGYHFVNWNDTSTNNPRTDTNVQANISVTANFAANPHTVTYKANGGVEADIVVNKNYGETVTVADNAFTRTGYNFTGWNTQADGNGTSYAPSDTFTLTDADVSLYAQWINASLPTQAITFGALADKIYGDATFDLTATASSGLAVSYASSNTNVATVSGNTVTIVGVGTTTITASQSGGGTHQPADSVDQTLTVTKKGLSISGVTVTSKPYDGNTSATYTGGSLAGVVDGDAVGFSGTVVFNDANAGDNQAVTANFALTGADKDKYTLTQPTLTGTISKGTQTLATFVDTTKNIGDAPFALPATTNAGTTVFYTSSKPSVATVSGNTITIAGLGTSTITAHADGGANYKDFDGSITLTVTLNPATVPTARAATSIKTNGFTANWDAIQGVDSYKLDVYTVEGSVTKDITVVGWDFKDSNIIADSGISANLNKTISTSSTGNITYPGGAAAAISNSGWDNGSASKYWRVSFTTVGMNNLKLSSKQQSSNTGPKDFKLQCSVNGTDWIDVTGAAITVANNLTTGVLENVALPSVCDNQILVYVRWIMTSNLQVGTGNVASAGTSRITDIVVIGDQGSVTNVPVTDSPFTVTENSKTVTDLQPDTDYHYMVKAVSGIVTTANSNEIDVTTKSSTVIWDNAGWSNTTGPDASEDAVIKKDYSGPSFESKSLTVNEGFTLTVPSGGYVKTGDVTNNGTIIVANNANFVQTGNFTAGTDSSFKVKRTSKEVKRLDYIAWSSPMKVSDQTLKSFSNETVDTRFFTYNEGKYVTVTSPATTKFTPGQGFQIRTPNNFTTTPQEFFGLFEGTVPNSGLVTYDASSIGGKYVFLGNPYPSALDMEAFYAANNGITGTFYIWDSASAMDANNEYSGSNYTTYTQLGTVPAGSEEGYVPVGQGFFVDRGTNTINNFMFTDAMRSGDKTGAFAKSGTSDKFWLQMTAPSGAKPQMLIGFHPNATEGYDAGLDAKMFDSNSDVIYSTVDGKSLIIDAHGSFNSTDVVHVNTKFLTTGNYAIGIARKEGIFENGQKIYLKDHVTGTEIELTAGDYTFAATAGLQADRFTITFSKGVLANADITKGQAKIYASQAVIYAKASSKIASVEVYDMSGKLMQTVSGKHATDLSFSVNHNGIAVVKMTLENGEIITNRVLLKK